MCDYSRTPLIRPPSESHWCGRIRGMVAREGFRYAALLQQRHTKYGRIRGMVVGEGGRSTGVLLYLALDCVGHADKWLCHQCILSANQTELAIQKTEYGSAFVPMEITVCCV